MALAASVPPLPCILSPFLCTSSPDPNSVQERCNKTCRREEECVSLNGTWGCACRRDHNSSGECSAAQQSGWCWRGPDLSGHGRMEGASEGQDEAWTGVSADGTEVGECEFSKPVGLQGWEAREAADLQGSRGTPASRSGFGTGRLDPRETQVARVRTASVGNALKYLPSMHVRDTGRLLSQSRICHTVALGPETSLLASLSLSVLICKMGIRY